MNRSGWESLMEIPEDLMGCLFIYTCICVFFIYGHQKCYIRWKYTYTCAYISYMKYEMRVARKHLSPKWDVFSLKKGIFVKKKKKHLFKRKPDDVGNFFLYIYVITNSKYIILQKKRSLCSILRKLLRVFIGKNPTGIPFWQLVIYKFKYFIG